MGKSYKWNFRIIYALLIVLIYFVFAYKPPAVHTTTTITQPAVHGKTPILGVDYFNGKDAVQLPPLLPQKPKDPQQPKEPNAPVNGIDGVSPAPCTTSQSDTETTITCPDGTVSVIPHPQNGRSPETRKNPKTGDIEWRLQDDFFWTVLLKKCDYTNCEVL